jgi:hypothetical protein
MKPDTTQKFFDKRYKNLKKVYEITEKLINLVNQNDFSAFNLLLKERKIILELIISEDKNFKNSKFIVNNELKKKIGELVGKIKALESQLFANMKLKIKVMNTEYLDRAKGLQTLKGYGSTYHNEQETYGYV